MTIFDTTVHPRDVVDGKFVDREQTPPAVTLGIDGMTDEQREQRRAALTECGFIPAVSGSAEKSGVTARRVNTWWDSHFVRAEYRPDSTGYPQMPDDYTPKRAGGQSIEGNRHTHRMVYTNDQVSLRMPSATSIKRYAAETGSTFDVPVTATFPGGDISGWVRVTKNGPNAWSAQGLNFPDGDSAMVSEAVGAILEARRPSTALREVPDLMVRRAERIASGGHRLQESPKESFISGAGYDRTRGVLAVKIGGRTYGYKAKPDRVRAFSNAHNIGQAYNRLIKGTKSAEVVECDKCNRFNLAGEVHRCPSAHKPPLTILIEATVAARKAAIRALR